MAQGCRQTTASPLFHLGHGALTAEHALTIDGSDNTLNKARTEEGRAQFQ